MYQQEFARQYQECDRNEAKKSLWLSRLVKFLNLYSLKLNSKWNVTKNRQYKILTISKLKFYAWRSEQLCSLVVYKYKNV